MTKARDLANLLGGGTSGVATFGGTAAIRVPNGTTEQRPTAAAGMIRFNTTTETAEVYDGTIWAPFGAPPPTISTVSPDTYNGESGTAFTITGTNFSSDATVFFITSGGTEVQAATVSVVSATEITATTPQDFTVADEPLDVKVVQSSGTATKLDAIDCGGVPTWNTSSGQIGGVIYEGDAVSTSLSASDPDSGATISYSVASGTLPSGLSLNSSTGAITGSAPSVASDTTYNFTAAATDNAGNSTARAFSIVIKDAYSKTNLWYDFDASDIGLSDGATISSGTSLTDRTVAATTTSGGTLIYRTANGGHLDFGSAAGYFRVTSSTDWSTLNAAQSISLVVWMQSDASSRQVAIARYGNSVNQFNHIVDPGGNYHYNSTGVISGASGDLSPPTKWQANTWFLTTWVYSVSDGVARWYMNNANQVATVTFGTDGGNGLSVGGSGSDIIGIGTRSDVYETLKGRIAIARIYTRALSVSDIQVEYAQFKTRFGLS